VVDIFFITPTHRQQSCSHFYATITSLSTNQTLLIYFNNIYAMLGCFILSEMQINLPDIYLVISSPDDVTTSENTAYTEEVIRWWCCPLNTTLPTSFIVGGHKLSFDFCCFLFALSLLHDMQKCFSCWRSSVSRNHVLHSCITGHWFSPTNPMATATVGAVLP
jgi:hypothetical protein